MRALHLLEPGRIELKDVAVPRPGPGELLIRVESATTCGTDLKAYRRGHPQIPMPGGFGHEYSGVVVQAGEGAFFAPGDEIMGVHSAPCQKCRWCRRGQENLCESIMDTKVLGSYAEGLLIPAHIARLNVFPKPAGLSFDLASLLEPLSCVVQGLMRAKPLPEDRVLVIGPGAIGLMFVACLRSMGLEDITLAGRTEARLQVGESMGAVPVLLDDVQGRWDLVIECTGKASVWEKSIDFVERGGMVMLFGGPPQGASASFSTSRLHYDDITLTSPFHFGTAAVKQAREWLIESPELFAPLISGTRRLEDAAEVFSDLSEGRGLKYAFRPGRS